MKIPTGYEPRFIHLRIYLNFIFLLSYQPSSSYVSPVVTEALWRKTDPKIAIPPKSQSVSGTDTMVTEGFPVGLVWFEDTSLVALVLLCMQEVSLVT